MNPVFIALTVFIILWVVGCLIYFNWKNNRPSVTPKAIIERKVTNQFFSDDNHEKDLTITISFNNKSDIDQAEFCDIVSRAKEFINRNIEFITKSKKNMFLPGNNEPEYEGIMKQEGEKEIIPEKKKEIIPERIKTLADFNFDEIVSIDTIIANSKSEILKDVVINEDEDI